MESRPDRIQAVAARSGGNEVHQNYGHDWGTPQVWADWIRVVSGGRIHTDPCTSPHHQSRVDADVAHFEDGLTRPWFGTVYVNGPGENSANAMQPWWDTAVKHLNGTGTTLIDASGQDLSRDHVRVRETAMDVRGSLGEPGVCAYDPDHDPNRPCDACAGCYSDSSLEPAIVWCLFNSEHLRTLKPSPLALPGLLVLPLRRAGFHRSDGPIARSPRNWLLFWFSRSAVRNWVDPPTECMLQETGRSVKGFLERCRIEGAR